MGLDMYLNGEITFHSLTDEQMRRQPISHTYRLGHWRKLPDLHEYIVEHFARGDDYCEKASLGKEELRQIIGAIKNDALPLKIEGSADAGWSSEEEKVNVINIFADAMVWISKEAENEFREVYYQPNW